MTARDGVDEVASLAADISRAWEMDGSQEASHLLRSILATAWDEGFDSGEADVFQHDEKGWSGDHDDQCIPNPYKDGSAS